MVVMVILDGKEVYEGEISPEKHRFIGTFRYPSPPHPTPDNRWDVFVCPCGANLWTTQEVAKHWRNGHMDVPQYVSMTKETTHGT